MAPRARVVALQRGNRFSRWITGLAILGALLWFGYHR